MIKVGTDFSGIGSPEQALKELGLEHDVLFACEKDKYARETYLANHSAKIMYDDITTRDNSKAPYVDLYCFGFPCQAFSISGKRKGFDDVRGTLFFNAAEYIREKRPKYFIAENVKGLLSHDKVKGSKSKHGRTFSTIINILAKTVNGQILMPMYEDNLGYNVFYTVLNSKYYDVPQNRERIFIVGFRDDVTFNFPTSKTVTKRLFDILEPIVDDKYYLSEKMIAGLSKNVVGYENRFTPKNGEDLSSTLKVSYHKMSRTDTFIEEPVCVAMRGREGAACLSPKRTDYGKDIRKDYENGKVKEKRKNIQKLEPRTDGITNTITSVQKDNLIIIGNVYENGGQAGKIYDTDAISPTVSGQRINSQGYITVKEATKKGYDIANEGDSINLSNPESKTRRGRVGKQIANTLDTSCNQAVIVGRVNSSQDGIIFSENGISQCLSSGHGNMPKVETKSKIRRLTPLECMRLQGFPDSFIKPCSDTQIYKQAGNSITVNVIKAIINNIKF